VEHLICNRLCYQLDYVFTFQSTRSRVLKLAAVDVILLLVGSRARSLHTSRFISKEKGHLAPTRKLNLYPGLNPKNPGGGGNHPTCVESPLKGLHCGEIPKGCLPLVSPQSKTRRRLTKQGCGPWRLLGPSSPKVTTCLTDLIYPGTNRMPNWLPKGENFPALATTLCYPYHLPRKARITLLGFPQG
jgi:hypothetical protein